MSVYTVHAPAGDGVDLAATDKFAFVREGFHFWAAVFTVIWLAWHRLWLALLGWVLLVIGVGVGLSHLGAGGGTIAFVDFVLALLVGLEAASLRRWTLERNKWRLIDIVVADSRDGAERRFFDRWAAKHRGVVNDQWSVDRGGPPPTRHVPGQPFSRPPPLPQGAIIGLFPEPGGGSR